MNDRVDITFREFYDVPRMFVVANDQVLFLFDGRFDDAIDDYPDHYEVFALPLTNVRDLPPSWLGLPDLATAKLGRVLVTEVEFDSTRRKSINVAIVRDLASKYAQITQKVVPPLPVRRPSTYA